ncbi:MAG: hypothetical protein C0506_06715 [Anaerolinea sp.]|nr:hypothetical protein [Anaerolinea sp.]
MESDARQRIVDEMARRRADPAWRAEVAEWFSELRKIRDANVGCELTEEEIDELVREARDELQSLRVSAG